MLARCVPGVFLHIKSQQLKLAILKTTEMHVVYYLFISFSSFVTGLFIALRGFFWWGGHKPELTLLCAFLSFSLTISIYLFLCLSVTVCPYLSVCLSLYLSEKGTHPRLSGLDLHGDLILANPRTVVFQLRPTVLHQPVITDHWIELLQFYQSGFDPHLMTSVCMCVCL